MLCRLSYVSMLEETPGIEPGTFTLDCCPRGEDGTANGSKDKELTAKQNGSQLTAKC